MTMTRRTMMMAAGATSALAALPRVAQAAFQPAPNGWRRFQITTRISLPDTPGPAQVWLPLPSVDQAGWMKSGETEWSTTAATATRKVDARSGAAMLHAAWTDAKGPRTLETTSVVATQDRAVDLSHPASHSLPADQRALYTAPTALIPTDGIVKATSDTITAGATSDTEKARRIYDWIVENTARNPETRGCGLGDIASMLEMGDLTGKCADLNALYVGLARAAGLPARDVYGIRVAPSNFGYKSLGAGSPDVTRAQHCRAEVYLDDHGWIPVDPADVRKVMLEEPPRDLPLTHPKVIAARETLFGAWEGNWIAYNFAHDVALPGSDGGPVEFLMYPQAEIGGERLDPLDYDTGYYAIEARELTG